MSKLDVRVFVACDFPKRVRERFEEQFDAHCNLQGRVLSREEFLAGAQDADAIVLTATDRLDADLVAQLPESVRVICTYSVGMEHVDLEALKARGIAFYSTPSVLDESVADVAMLLMLGAARRVRESMALLETGAWEGWSPRQLLGHDIWGRRLGILGMGRIGQAIAMRGRGFGMEIHYHNRRELDAQQACGATYHADVAALARHSDVLCIACPSTPQTRGIVNAELIDQLPQEAIVCNIARGDIVDDAALVEALRSGKVAAAGLDVFDGEPDIDPAYRTLPNVFALPHIGSSTWGTRLAMAQLLCDSLKEFFAGKPSTNRIL